MKRLLTLLFSRLAITIVLIAVQAVLLLMFILRLNNYFYLFYAGSIVLSICVVLALISRPGNPSFKLAYTVPILLFPIVGGVIYLFFGMSRTRRKDTHWSRGKVRMAEYLDQGAPPPEGLHTHDVDVYRQMSYIHANGHFPVYQNTSTRFFPWGKDKHTALLEDLESAEHFIFLEYFIVAKGEMWDAILAILRRKAAQGVDVRVMYDDMGCVSTLPLSYKRVLEGYGIQCEIFNVFVPALLIQMNNRDHRKIAVIDGNVGYTGGINLSDEYIGLRDHEKVWKDCAVRLEGDAVRSLTMMFLSLWNTCRPGADADFDAYSPTRNGTPDGLLQPYAYAPDDEEILAEGVYMNMINRANDYLYIASPYFIVDNELITALSLAAKSGVDVRIITPGIGDKWPVYTLTRAFYPQLIKAGIKVYEFPPGFIHSKYFVSDDKTAVVGTVNLDYRSLYLHLECGVFFYESQAVLQVRDDYLKTLESCCEITYEQSLKRKWYERIASAVMMPFAPML